MTAGRWWPYPSPSANAAAPSGAPPWSSAVVGSTGLVTPCSACITTRAEPPWPGDHRIRDLAGAGLPVPCIVRLKLFTLDNRLIEEKLSRLGNDERTAVRDNLASALSD